MILPFSTQLNGKEIFFVEKILRGIEIYKAPISLIEYWKFTGFDLFLKQMITPKFHTIREDKNNRWKVHTNIDFFINVRQKSMFRFAPVLPVVSIQKIEIKWIGFNDKARPWLRVDGKNIYTVDAIEYGTMLEFANNDGFDTIEDFFAYFNKDFKGKIIHWTDIKY